MSQWSFGHDLCLEFIKDAAIIVNEKSIEYSEMIRSSHSSHLMEFQLTQNFDSRFLVACNWNIYFGLIFI